MKIKSYKKEVILDPSETTPLSPDSIWILTSFTIASLFSLYRWPGFSLLKVYSFPNNLCCHSHYKKVTVFIH
jgi:hypothetical protein